MNVVIIDDSGTIGAIVHKILISYGYNPHIHPSKNDILGILKTYPQTLIILNTFLKDKNSIDLCSQIREKYPHVIIIGIHAKGGWQEKIEFLNSGADDCLSFPFPTTELVARIQAILRRPKRSEQISLKYGSISLHPLKQKVYYKNERMDLTKKEYHVLEYMLRNQDRTITRSELLDHVWDYTRIINSNTVDVHIQKLRKKMRSINSKLLQNNGGPPKTRNNETLIPTNEKLPRTDTKGNSPEDKSDGRPYAQNSLAGRKFAINETEIRTIHGIGYRLDGNFITEETSKPPPDL